MIFGGNAWKKRPRRRHWPFSDGVCCGPKRTPEWEPALDEHRPSLGDFVDSEVRVFFFRDLHHRNLDNEQRWFTVDFEFYVEIPCSLKHLFFQIQSFPELFAMRSYRDRSFWPWPVSHRSTSSALGQSAEKGQPSKSSANELKRRALWGRWVEVGCPLQMDLNIWRCMEHPQ